MKVKVVDPIPQKVACNLYPGINEKKSVALWNAGELTSMNGRQVQTHTGQSKMSRKCNFWAMLSYISGCFPFQAFGRSC